MQFIYKKHDEYSKRGHNIINSFISDCWQEDCEKYINLEYQELKRNRTFNELLIEEQKGYCCYCMREIKKENTTLEHVIPQHIKEKDIEDQLPHYHCYISPQNVQYQSEIKQDEKLECPPYPHTIAYENLTASCKGKIYENGKEYTLHACCNHKRKNDKIIPLFFLPKIHSIIEYEEDGTLLFKNEYEETIKSLNINCDSLQLIRKVWARIRQRNIRIKEVEMGAKDEEVRKNIAVRLDIEPTEEKKIIHILYWELLIQFKWFYHYFNLKYLKY